MTTSYNRRIKSVCDYIHEHLEEDLSLERLSSVAAFSKYHFHRQFQHYTGISVARFISMQRLKRASYQLVFHRESRVLEIALDAGFDSPEAFSRAFKRAFDQTPSQFRRNPKWEPWHKEYQFKTKGVTKEMKVQIQKFDGCRVAVLEHKGPAESLNHSVASFIEWRKTSQLSPVSLSETYGVPHNDPNAVEPDEFRFDICGVVQEPVPENPQGVITKEIPSGRCAVLRHLGSRDHLDEKIYYLYRDWLPESGHELRDFPVYFRYLNFYPEVPENELVTDIYLPLLD